MSRLTTSRRRALLGLGLGAGLALTGRPLRAAGAEATLEPDGLWRMPWYRETFLDLVEDRAQAAAEGRRLAVLWGLKGCPACRTLHVVTLADPAVAAYAAERFLWLHLNVQGARPVTDFDGAAAAEKALAAKWGLRGTPTLHLFPAGTTDLAALAPTAREADRIEGAPAPADLLARLRRAADGA